MTKAHLSITLHPQMFAIFEYATLACIWHVDKTVNGCNQNMCIMLTEQ